MVNATERRAEEKAGKEADAKTRRRAEQAAIVTALRTVLDGDEQLLGFARGRIAGGWRGKLNVGPEAFFAPHVNIGLSERRVILQHIHPEDGKPSEIAPHFFDIADLQALTFTDIETFGAEPAGRIVLEFNSEQRFRMRVKGGDNLADGQALAEVFQSLTTARRKSRTSPTQTVCPSCVHVLDQPSRFCPYCGAAQAPPSPAGETATPDASAPSGAAGFADFRAPSNAGFADASAPPVPGFADASVPPPPPGSNPPPAPGDTIPFAPFAGENPPPPVAPTPPMPFQSASPPAPSAPDNADTPVFTLPSDGGVTQAPAAPAAAPESFDAWVSRVAPRLTVTPETPPTPMPPLVANGPGETPILPTPGANPNHEKETGEAGNATEPPATPSPFSPPDVGETGPPPASDSVEAPDPGDQDEPLDAPLNNRPDPQDAVSTAYTTPIHTENNPPQGGE